MRIDPTKLGPGQYAGHACVVDGTWFQPGQGRARVGVLGDDQHYVYACPGQCARQVDQLVMDRHDSADRSGAPDPDRSAVQPLGTQL